MYNIVFCFSKEYETSQSSIKFMTLVCHLNPISQFSQFSQYSQFSQFSLRVETGYRVRRGCKEEESWELGAQRQFSCTIQPREAIQPIEPIQPIQSGGWRQVIIKQGVELGFVERGKSFVIWQKVINSFDWLSCDCLGAQ